MNKKLKIKNPISELVIAENQKLIAKYINEGNVTSSIVKNDYIEVEVEIPIAEGTEKKKIKIPVLGDGTIKPIQLGEFHITGEYLINAFFTDMLATPFTFSEGFNIKDTEGNTITDAIINLPDGCYVFDTQGVIFDDFKFKTEEQWLNYCKQSGFYDSIYNHFKNISLGDSNVNIDDIIEEGLISIYSEYFKGNNNSVGLTATMIASFSNQYWFYIKRDKNCSLLKNLLYNEMYKNIVDGFISVYGEPDEELIWSIPTTGYSVGDMTFVEWRKDGKPLCSTWYHAASRLISQF